MDNLEVEGKETECEGVQAGNDKTMADFEDEINRSFRRLKVGDIVKGNVIGVSDSQADVDLGYYAQGIIRLEEFSYDPHFSIKADVSVGDTIAACVISEDDGEGNILLSVKRAADVLAWDVLSETMREEKILSVKVAEVVNAGVVAYVEGIRGFIPASQLALTYVENLEDYVGKTLDVRVITVEKERKKLVLSAKSVARERADKEKEDKIAKLQKGIVVEGTVETLMPYGCFVGIGDGLSGLVHISQICGRHIKHPKEIVKEGDTVKVKILDVVDGKVKLSMKAVAEEEEALEAGSMPVEYTSDEEAVTGLGSLLAGLKLNLDE